MPPKEGQKGNRGRSHSSSSYLSVNQSPNSRASVSDSGCELSPTLVGSILSHPRPHTPYTPSSTLSPSPGFKSLTRRPEDDGTGDGLSFELQSPTGMASLSDIFLGEVPDIEDNHEPPKCGDDFQYPISDPRVDPWEVAINLAKSHDKIMCDGWKEEIDKLLIFAGLFAATVVAFLMVSYQLLQPSPIDVQKANYAMFSALIRDYQMNGTIPENNLHLAPSPNNYHPSPSVLRMNVTWFLSMTLALTTVLIGTICLQWIREYLRDPRLNPKQAFALRQMRWDGLLYWKVPFIISCLPVLLQLALLLFFWGLLEFLWSLNTAVTMINSVVIGAVFFFMTATICIPAMQSIFISSDKLRGHQSPYKSPQARVFVIAAVWIALQVIKFLRFRRRDESHFLQKKMKFLEGISQDKSWDDWVSFDNQWQSERMVNLGLTDSQAPATESCDIPRGLAWLGNTYLHNQDGIYALYHLLRRIHPSTSFQTLKRLTLGVGSHSPSVFTDIRNRDILADLHSAFLLSHIVNSGKDPQLQEALRIHRSELFIRIANYGANACATHQQLDEVEIFVDKCLKDKECGINPFVGNEDYVKLPDNMIHQILVTFQTYLSDARVFHDGLWEIVKPMIAQIASNDIPPSDNNLVDQMGSLNEALLKCYRHGANPQRHRDNITISNEWKRIHEYVTAIKNRRKDISGHFIISRFAETFQPLEQACYGAQGPGFTSN